MSHSRQTAGNRRLPPIGKQVNGVNHLNVNNPSSGNSRNQFRNPTNRTRTSADRRTHNGGINMVIKGRGAQLSNSQVQAWGDVTPDAVVAYLSENPDVLDKFVTAHCKQDQVEKWLIHIIKKNQKSEKDSDTTKGEPSISRRASLSRWKLAVHGDKRQMLQELTRDIHRKNNKAHVLAELTVCVASAVSADGYNLYILDEYGTELCFFQPPSELGTTKLQRQNIESGTTIATYVARTMKPVCVSELKANKEYPDGIGAEGTGITSVLCQPVVEPGGALLAVVELYRNSSSPPFQDFDQEVVSSYLIWGAFAVHYAEMYHTMTKQRKLNDFLLTVTKSIFQDIISMDTVIMKIMNFAQKLVNADRASLFLVDNKTNELYARIFDIGNGVGAESAITTEQKEIRFPLDKGVAGYVASTGNTLNIKDAYQDNRFNRDVDIQTGYRTKTLLCMPIYIRGSVIGVVQMVNKLNGTFSKADEEAFETFAVYCGLALHHAKLYDKIRRSEQKYKVALEVLTYHNQCSETEFHGLKKEPLPREIDGITSFEFTDYLDNSNDKKPLMSLYMFKDLFELANSTRGVDTRFDVSHLIRFTLTVRKNYRRVPYHNWTHGFSVSQSMYAVIKSDPTRWSLLESLSMFVAALCHDLDHRGKNNAYMIKSSSPLAAIYSTSTMEHHHFNQTVSILQQDGHNILRFLSSEEYKVVLANIKHCILATDLALFFPNKAKLKGLVDSNEFSWDKKENRELLQAIIMTGCDLSASIKPWDIQVKTVKVIFEEFYEQGDEEKAQGRIPIPMMDRDRAHELPGCQVGFLTGICIPCYDVITSVMPTCRPMFTGASANLVHWKALAEEQKPKEEEKKQMKEAAEKKEAKGHAKEAKKKESVEKEKGK